MATDGLNKNAINFSYSACLGSSKKREVEERKVNPEEEIQKLLHHLNGFYEENPNYQQGLVQVAVPALRVDFGAYFISLNEMVENILITSTPQRGAGLYVATLQQARRGVSQGLRYQRVASSRSYYIWQEKGNYKYHLLLDNNDWLNSLKVDNAFLWLLKKIGGSIRENLGWRDFRVFNTQIREIGRICRYIAKDGSYRMFICMINSGTILDVGEDEAKCGDTEYRYRSGSNEFGHNVLRFKFTDAHQIERCNNL